VSPGRKAPAQGVDNEIVPPTRRRFLCVPELLGREAYPLALVAFYAVLLAGLAPFELVGDSWLTLASGREVAQHGLPQHDQLMAFSQGVRWVDQQWLAQFVFYQLTRLDGIQAAVLLHVVLLTSAFALAVTGARRRGCSGTTIFVVGLGCLFLAPWAWQLRAQSFAYPLFVGTLLLLSADSRKPSRRVVLVLPLLALWANLHGSVVLGAALAALRGLTILFERLRSTSAQPAWKLRAGCLLLAPLAAFVSPYGLSLFGYYRHLLGSPLLSRFVQEWGPTTPTKAWLFYPMVLLVVWLLGRNGAALTRFERAALLATACAAFVALRHIVWFELATLSFLPVLVATAPAGRLIVRPSARWLGGLAALCLVAIPFGLAASHSAWLEQTLPRRATAELKRVTARPGVSVFASETLSDWLLWAQPSLRGRIAYDVRFELLSARQLDQLSAYHRRSGPDWAAPTRPFSIIVLDRRVDSKLGAALLARAGTRPLFEDRNVLVLRQRISSPLPALEPGGSLSRTAKQAASAAAP
jgi:hypothetical protein